MHSVIVDPPKKEQKVAIVMTADQPVGVMVVLEKDIPGKDIEKYDPAKTPPLASEKPNKTASLVVTIPANETFYVVFSGATKRAAVNVKIDSQ
jgi:hypothetical protein